jgi:hypothetical protein
MRRLVLTVAGVALAIGAAACMAAGSPPKDAGGDWSSHGRDAAEQRFSPLTKVDAANVSQLGLAWFTGLSERGGYQSTPLVIDGRMYVTTPWSKVYASTRNRKRQEVRSDVPPRSQAVRAATSPTGAWLSESQDHLGNARWPPRGGEREERQEDLGRQVLSDKPIPSPARRASATVSSTSVKAAASSTAQPRGATPRPAGTVAFLDRTGQSGQGSGWRCFR